MIAQDNVKQVLKDLGFTENKKPFHQSIRFAHRMHDGGELEQRGTHLSGKP